MPTNMERILDFIASYPGRDDDEIARLLKIEPRQTVNQICRKLRDKGRIERKPGAEGKIENYIIGSNSAERLRSDERIRSTTTKNALNGPSEDDVKRAIQKKLESEGWTVQVAWGNARGIDIVATRERERWVIECKGPGSLPPMQNNYFVGVIGELLQRMSDEKAKHSLAFPDLPKFRRLWIQLPTVAKRRLGLTCFFVSSDQYVAEVLE